MPIENQEDENVRIPDAVKRAAERANAHFAKEEDPNEPPKEDEAAQEPAHTTEDHLAEPDNDGGREAGDDDSGDDSAGGEEGEDEVTSEGNWEHKYKSMKGRHDKSEERLAATTARLGQMEQTIASLEPATEEPVEAPTISTERRITDTEESDYGTEFLDVVGKKAMDTMTPQLAQLQEQFNTLSSQLAQVDGTVSSNARTTMETELNSTIPNWQTINHDPQFMAWLQLPDAYSGVIRHELLKTAHQRNDAPRVLAFFNGFLAEEAAVAPAALTPDPAEGELAQDGKVPLENYAAPGRAKTPAAQQNAPEEKPIISRAQISKFYTDVAAGKFKGKDKEKNKLEGAIFAAKKAGRIR